MIKDIIIVISIILTLEGCATSSIPEPIRIEPLNNPTLAEVRENIPKYMDIRVRWGGTIATIENQENDTLIEIVARDLSKNGRPKNNDKSEGRFQARINGFLDPVVYETGRDLTIAGVIEGKGHSKIGEYDYNYPIVAAHDYYLWKPLPTYANDPFYHDPWLYDPWYPYPFYRPYSPYYW